VVVTNGNSCSATSAGKTVTVNALPATPTITNSTATTFCSGGNVVLTSSGSGNQWYKDGNLLNGETNSTYTASTSGSYTVTVTDGNSCSATSTGKTVTVNALPATPTITNSTATTFCSGGSVVLTSSGSGNQWYKDGNLLNGETNSTYTASTGGTYTVVVTNGNSCSATSTGKTVTVNALPATPTITNSTATTFCSGGSVVLTSSGSGNQWYKDGNLLNGETNSTYTASTGGTYTVVVTNGNSCSATSTGKTVTVNALPATPTITNSTATTFCSGGSVVLTSSGSGNQWYKDGSLLNGETNSTYTASTGGTYTVVVTNGNSCSATSAGKTVTVNALPATPTITNSTATTFCSGGSVVLTSSGSGNQWYKDGNLLNGETNSAYTASTSGTYTVVVTNGNSCSATSAGKTVTVNTLPATPTITNSTATTFCSGGNVVLTSSGSGNQWYKDGNLLNGETNPTYTASTGGNYTVVVTNVNSCSATSAGKTVIVNTLPATPTITNSTATTFCSGGSVVLTSSGSGNQWYKDGNLLSGATNPTYTASAAGSYTVMVTNGNNCSATSAGRTVTVNPLPATPTITAGGVTTFCTGGSVVLTSSATNGNQWYKDGNILSGETNPAYTATANGSYKVIATNSSSCSATSVSTIITVNTPPAKPVIAQSGPLNFCTGGSVTLSAPIATAYLWNTNDITQSVTASTTGIFNVKVQDANGCWSPVSDNSSVTAVPYPIFTVSSQNGNRISRGESTRLTASGATGNIEWTPAAGLDFPLSFAPLARPMATTTYMATVTNTTGCATSHNITIEVIDDYKVTPKKVMTLNGDGVNDYFVIENIDAYPNNVLQIFDRAGKKIYEKQGYRNDWNGVIRSRDFINDTYFYVLSIDGKIVRKGSLTIIK
jgi:gliding motility-associated-like protein